MVTRDLSWINHLSPEGAAQGRGVVIPDKSMLTMVSVLYILRLIGPTRNHGYSSIATRKGHLKKNYR